MHLTPLPHVIKLDIKIRHRQAVTSPFRPFDQYDIVILQNIAKPRIKPFQCIAKAIKIKMIEMQPRKIITLYERVARALDPPGDTAGLEQGSDEAGLSTSQLTAQMNSPARIDATKEWSKPLRQRDSCRFILQKTRYLHVLFR